MTADAWRRVRVADLVAAGDAEVKTGPFGTQLRASDYVESGTPVINVRNIGFGGIRADKLEYITDDTVRRLSGHVLHTGDIVFGRKGAVERHVLIRNPQSRWFQGSDCLRLRLRTKQVLPQFLSYCLLTTEHQTWMMQQCSHGATMASLNQDIVGRIEFSAPDLSEQHRITSILSAYDELIANNTRRIAILDEMARRIYEEWFVRFRFPGHEGVRMVESELGFVPEGWSSEVLANVCEPKTGIQTGPFGSQLHRADYSAVGVPVVMPKNLIGFRIEEDSVARVQETTAAMLNRHRMRPRDIVYGRRGDIGRRAFIMSHQDGWLCGTGCLRIRPDAKKISSWFVFNYLGQENVVGLIAGRAHGVTMPNLNTRLLESVPVICPPRELQDGFERITFPTADLRENLSSMNANLETTRGLLLTKLLSGELDLGAIPEREALSA